ncbi:MAG: hypothetical protein JNK87_30005 [Bryobacterales bacterium]|nr:hypothetical protein [Bryobacterales bacterium]
MYRLGLAVLLLGASALSGAPAKPVADPRITSAHPVVLRKDAPTEVVFRGVSLAGARAIWTESDGVTGEVLHVQPDGESDAVRVRLRAGTNGPFRVRLLAARGVTNEVTLRTTADEVMNEPAVTLERDPVMVTGRLANKGETDTIWMQARRGQVVTFTAGGNFDPSITLAEPTGSWFEERRLNRVAFNDEPLHFPGLSQESRLVHRFERDGRYAVQVRAFSGQGGPDLSYWLRIGPGVGDEPSLKPVNVGQWEERLFVRRLSADWLKRMALRGGAAEAAEPAVVAADAAVLPIPGVVEGRITKPAEVHRVKMKLDKAQDLAIEVETPQATMPRFNPVVRLLAADGSEMVTNVYTKRNNNGLYMMKMIQAKSTFTLRAPGEYTLEIRDITTDVAGDDFAYRVLVRPQIPHVGKVDVVEDRINLEPGQSKAITVNVDREEEFKGLVLVGAEGLPAGVTATAGMANPVERPPLPNGGRVERYVAKPQTATLILSAAADAVPGEVPVKVRVLVRTVVDGQAGEAIVAKEIPVLVIPRRPS